MCFELRVELPTEQGELASDAARLRRLVYHRRGRLDDEALQRAVDTGLGIIARILEATASQE